MDLIKQPMRSTYYMFNSIFFDFLICSKLVPGSLSARFEEMNSITISSNIHGYYTEQGKVLWAECKKENLNVYCCGELYAYKSSDGRAAQLLPKISDDIQKGQFDPVELDGQFVLIVEEVNQTTVFTDRMGVQHCYLGQKDGELVVGTCFDQVSKAIGASQNDWVGITQFCGVGFFMEDRTWFEEVKILRPATKLVLEINSQNKWQVKAKEQYWQWSYTPKDNGFENTLDEYDHLLKQAVQRRCHLKQEKMGIGISGGLDSRNLVGCLPDHASVWSYSYGYGKNSIETEIASQIVKAKGITHESFAIPHNFFERFEEGMRATEGFQDLTQARQLHLMDKIGQHADYLLAGHWGDVWNDCMIPQDAQVSNNHQWVDLAMRKFLKKGSDWLFENICKPRLDGKSPLEIIRQSIDSEMKRIPIEDFEFKFKAFKTWQWAFRWTNTSLRVFQLGAYPRCPFYDRDLIDFFSRTPHHHVKNRKLQIAWFKKYAPKLAQIKWQKTGARLCAEYPGERFVSRIQNRLLRFLGVRSSVKRNWEEQLLTLKKLPAFLIIPAKKIFKIKESDLSSSNVVDLASRLRLPHKEKGYALSMAMSILWRLEMSQYQTAA